MKLGENVDRDAAILKTLTNFAVAGINMYEDDEDKEVFMASLVNDIALAAGLDLMSISLMNLRACHEGWADEPEKYDEIIKERDANEVEHNNEETV